MTAAVYQCSALDLPPTLGCGFSALIIDPPYSARVHARATSNNPGGRDTGVAARDLGFAHLTPALRHHLARIAAHVPGWSVVFSDLESAWLWRHTMAAAGLEYVRAVPWVRWSQPQLSGDRPGSGAELVSVFHPRGRKAWGGPGSLTHFNAKALRGKQKYSCEKPLDLMLSLVSYFCPPGGVVLDCVCGAGTTGAAAGVLGRDALLCDVSADAVARAQMYQPDPTRVQRWAEYQRDWLTREALSGSVAGRARRAWAEGDLERVDRWLAATA